MSLYIDIYNDLPLRCAEVWEKYRASAAEQGREVTLMLMAATAGFAMPWDKLSRKDDSALIRSIDKNRKSYDKAVDKLVKELSKTISDKENELFEGVYFDNWKYFQIPDLSNIKNIIEMGLNKNEKPDLLKNRAVLKILRNALAHNNLHAPGDGIGGEISFITFISQIVEDKKVVGFHVLTLSVRDFEIILDNWFNFMKKIKKQYIPKIGLNDFLSSAISEHDYA